MKQQVRSTPHGKTLVIEGFDPILTSPGLTPRGLLELDAIIIKNCLSSQTDALILHQEGQFILQEINTNSPIKNDLKELLSRWISLTITENIYCVKIKS